MISIPLTRRVINNIEEHQWTVLDSYADGMDRGTNTSPVLSLDEQEVEIMTTSTGQQSVVTQAELQDNTLQPESPEIEETGVEQADPINVQTQDTEVNAKLVEVDTSEKQPQIANTNSQVEEQQEPDIPDDQTSRASQDDNYQTAIDDDEPDDTIQFGNLVTQLFLSRSVRVPIIEVGCLSFTQMLQNYLRAYPLPSHADAYLQIQQMAQWLDVYLSKYPAQYINYMTSDSEFVAFVNHTIQLTHDLTVYPNIWAVLLILLETQDVNASYMQTMHDYYNRCYDTRTQDYMELIEKAAEQSKNNMYNNNLDGVSGYVQ